jgi:hypothetical protein
MPSAVSAPASRPRTRAGVFGNALSGAAHMLVAEATPATETFYSSLRVERLAEADE